MAEPAADTHPTASPSASAGDGPDICLRSVTKQFGGLTAVDDLSLEIPRGSFFAMLGPSGCGKTTTLRMIGGFEEPTAGVIELGGAEVTNIPPHKRDVNTVFQSYALFPHLSVEDNIGFGLARKRVAKADARKRVAEIIDLVQLGGLGKRRPAQLSGGQQQRVALARALVNKPRALLLDEPLGALDLRLRKQLQLELSQIQREIGITFVHVTHDQEEAMTMADSIAVMRDGKIDQLAGPAELYNHPQTEFVANFLGSSNLIDATARGTHEGVAEYEVDGGAVVRAREVHTMDGPVRIGVRPEKLTLEPAEGAAPVSAGRNALLGHITEASFLGVSTRYAMRTAGGADLEVFVQNAGSSVQHIGPGLAVRASWDPEFTFVVAKEA